MAVKLEYEPRPQSAPTSRIDDVAYILPILVFLLLTYMGAKWRPFLPWSYPCRYLAAGALVVAFWPRYTRIRWNAWGLGIIVGVIGIVQWVGMEKVLVHFWPGYWRIPGAAEALNPWTAFPAAGAWAYLAARLVGMAVVVPFMEELFWRDYLWRQLQSPNNFKIPAVGEWEWQPFAIVALAFASVHPFWMTAIVWGLMIGCLLVYTRSLGACIIAHGVTNLLLWLYVIWTGDWAFL